MRRNVKGLILAFLFENQKHDDWSPANRAIEKMQMEFRSLIEGKMNKKID